MASFEDHEERLAALEDLIDGDKLTIGALPVHPLIKLLESEWQPDLPDNFKSGLVEAPRIITGPGTPRVELSHEKGLFAVDDDGHVIFQVPFDGATNTVLTLPFAQARQVLGVQTIPDSTVTLIDLDTTIADNKPGGVDQVAGPGLTCQQAGLYFVVGSVVWTGLGSGSAWAELAHNGGAASRGSDSFLRAGVVGTQVFDAYQLAAGDTVELRGFQDSGGPIDTSITLAGSALGWLKMAL